jgi:integrase
MSTIRQRGGQFHVQVRMSGYPSRTGSFPTRRLAERWAKTIEAEMIEGRHFRNADARRRTVAEAIERYEREELPKLRSAVSRRNRASKLKWWKERIGSRKLAEISSALISDRKQELAAGTYSRAKPSSRHSLYHGSDSSAPSFKRSGETVDGYLVAIARVFSIAKREWQWTHSNPCESVSKFGGSKRVRYLIGDEQERLFSACAAHPDPQLLLIASLALSTAPRAGELTNLDWSDVEFEMDDKDPAKATVARLLLRLTKNAEPRTAWIHGRAFGLLRQWHETRGKPAAGRVFNSVKGKKYDYSDSFKAAVKSAGIKNFRFHDLRHSSATYLAREGATEQQLKAIGGWKSNVVSRYVHLAAEDAKAVVQKMNEKVLGK